MCCIFYFTWYATYTRGWFINLHLCQYGSEKRWITAAVILEKYYIWRDRYQLARKSPLTMIGKKKSTTNFNTNNRNGDYLKVGCCVKYSIFAAEVIQFLTCRSILVRRVWEDVNVTGLFRGVILVLSRNELCEQKNVRIVGFPGQIQSGCLPNIDAVSHFSTAAWWTRTIIPYIRPVAYRGWIWGVQPPPRNSEGPHPCQIQPDCENC